MQRERESYSNARNEHKALEQERFANAGLGRAGSPQSSVVQDQGGLEALGAAGEAAANAVSAVASAVGEGAKAAGKIGSAAAGGNENES